MRPKITSVLIILIILGSLSFVIFQIVSGKIRPKASENGANLSLSYVSPISVGDIFPVYLYLANDSNLAISEVSINGLNYDKEKLAVQGNQVLPDSTNDWLINTNSITEGKIIYSLMAKDNLNGFKGNSSRLGIVNFIAIASGEASLNFDFAAGSKSDSNIIGKADQNDILSSAPNSLVSINGGIGNPKSSKPSPPQATSSGAQVAAFGESKSTVLLLVIGLPALVVIVVFLIWFFRRKNSLKKLDSDQLNEANKDEEIL